MKKDFRGTVDQYEGGCRKGGAGHGMKGQTDTGGVRVCTVYGYDRYQESLFIVENGVCAGEAVRFIFVNHRLPSGKKRFLLLV